MHGSTQPSVCILISKRIIQTDIHPVKNLDFELLMQNKNQYKFLSFDEYLLLSFEPGDLELKTAESSHFIFFCVCANTNLLPSWKFLNKMSHVAHMLVFPVNHNCVPVGNHKHFPFILLVLQKGIFWLLPWKKVNLSYLDIL